MKKPIQAWKSGLCIITTIFTLAIAEAPRLIQWIQQNSKEVTNGAIAPHSSRVGDRLCLTSSAADIGHGAIELLDIASLTALGERCSPRQNFTT